MDAIKITNLNFKYDSDNENYPIITDLNLSIKEGELVALVGQNAGGKSTLAKLINGLLQPNSGMVEVFGIATNDKDKEFEVRKSVGMVFQNPDNQMVANIVEDDIAFGPENLGLSRDEIEERIEFALSAVGMEAFRNSTPHRLSGGQKQRIAVAGVLAIKPKILILDEATSMLDPRGRREVFEVVKKLNRERNITVLVITHFMEEAISCDRVIVLDKGKVVLDGAPKEVFENKEVIDNAKLELPKALYLSRKLVELGVLATGELDEEEFISKIVESLK